MPRASSLLSDSRRELPITARREAIEQLLRRHPVLIVAGDTGSGKSTQLPQYCLGLFDDGVIAHTQPRRLAARALAARIAEERSEAVGATVGFRVRFADRLSAGTRLVLMTDGLLLSEIALDPTLSRYRCVIVDEAHERSLNIDLLLGVLKRLLPRRPDLKLIVTSATLDVERVANFFSAAPVITVSGRSHPIELRYAPPLSDLDDPDLPQSILGALRALTESPGPGGSGDVLVFLPGEREIRDVGEVLERELDGDAEVLALYSRLSWEEQRRILEPGSRRRIVLSTNLAETSITVPGIRAVIDSGLARISRYSPRSRLQRLPIEPISRASADQRKGRCGRLGPGVCVRLYSEQEFDARPAYTEPEVLRTNLAALLLRLAADGLGAAEQFPFIDAPDARALGDGYRVLQELQALDAERRITPRGRAMARLPLDPRLARALLESKRFHAESEVLAIVSGLSVPDVRIGRPAETFETESETGSSDSSLGDAKSEFSAMVKLWRVYRRLRQGPRGELRRWCRARGFSSLRFFEWENVHDQVVDRAREFHISAGSKPASYTAVHRSLLAGFLTLVGNRGEEGMYWGTRGARFFIFPGSPLRRRKPRWIMAANIVETSRIFARTVAEIEPIWLEAAAKHLLKREYLAADWDEDREQVSARERVSFLGLTLSAHRLVNYGPIAPEDARLIFAREALVYRRLERRPAWVEANDGVIRAAQNLEDRLRTRSLLKPVEFFVDHYVHALPRQVSSAATLEQFTRRTPQAELEGLTLKLEEALARLPDPQDLRSFPEQARIHDVTVNVQYRFAPGEPGDGATLSVPLLALPRLMRREIDAVVPGLARPRVEALLRSLPKEARRSLIPIALTALDFMQRSSSIQTDELALVAYLKHARGVPEALLRFPPNAVPAHLIVQVEIHERGREIARGTDLKSLRQRCAGLARDALDAAARARDSVPWRRFHSLELPSFGTLDLEQGRLAVYPTLVQSNAELFYGLEWSEYEAERRWQRSAVQLARFILQGPVKEIAARVARDVRLTLAAHPFLRSDRLVALLIELALGQACFEDTEPPRSQESFTRAVDAGSRRLETALVEATTDLSCWLASARAVRRMLEDAPPALLGAAAETDRHLHDLLNAESIAGMPPVERRQLSRRIKAEERRWRRVLTRGTEAAEVLEELTRWNQRLKSLESRVAAELRIVRELDEFRFWVEEYRVSLYAQDLGTPGPVSSARLEARAALVEEWLNR